MHVQRPLLCLDGINLLNPDNELVNSEMLLHISKEYVL